MLNSKICLNFFFFFCKQINEEISHRTEQLLSIFHEKLFSHVEAHVVVNILDHRLLYAY